MTFEAARFVDGNKIADARAALSMSDDRLLTGNAYLRPALYKNVQNLLRPDNFASMYPQREIDGLARTIEDDLNLKSNYVSEAVRPIGEAADYAVNEVSAKADEIRAAFRVMYRKNEFYMSDIYDAVDSFGDRVR